MQPESPLPLTPETKRFITHLPDEQNILKWGIHFAMGWKVIGEPLNRIQFVVTGVMQDGASEGFSINLN